MPDVRYGLEVFAAEPPAELRRARCGLLLNQASVDGRFEYAQRVIEAADPGRLVRLFGPQHGLFSEQQDNMVESAHGVDPLGGLPVHSLYSEVRRPTAEMLGGLDWLLIDLQDVGVRVYTYVWTALECLRQCADSGVSVMVLDRPNPLGGVVTEGDVLEPEYFSFVGMAPVPLRHGMTLGELLMRQRDAEGLDVELRVVGPTGWDRDMLWPDTGRAWVPPSPNLPRWQGAMVYPGQVLLEGTNLSEGRGTTTPFEVCGAPWLDPAWLAAELNAGGHPGLAFRPLRFVPTFQKHAGRSCGGVFWHVTGPAAVRSVAATVHLLELVAERYPDQFAWKSPPYEFETVKPPIDILWGNDRLRRGIGPNDPTEPSA